ncbi:hypothetical protein [Ralstonia phage RP12]|uniref:Uncharacterized protein n=1 Tax=Ralstonia phage RP12 TaxID=1923889 RepID=A0A1L7N149_9CAUD|nr:hypothetical protein FDH28_gp199 [Ralstonia phage RP12]BAW19196.1 hypothetical protein [Ralstonia phage RP12]
MNMSKIKFKIICASIRSADTDQFDACAAILKCCGLQYDVVTNFDEVIQYSKGQVNPSKGFIIKTPYNEVLIGWYQLVEWIKDNGLIPC